MRAALIFLVFALVGTLAAPTEITYKLNQQINYKLTGHLDARGQKAGEQERSGGTTSTMTSIVAMKCVEVHSDHYLVVMNMFNTQVGVGGLEASDEQRVFSDALGADMYFKHMKTGEIPTIWYRKGDSPYFVEVKVGAINAFQTRMVGVGKTIDVLENDPVGSHFSKLSGATGSSTPLIITKRFTQSDFKAFPDKGLTKDKVQIEALSVAAVHQSGYIESSTVEQHVKFVNHGPKHEGLGAAPVVDMDISSKGSLGITFGTKIQGIAAYNLEATLSTFDLTNSDEHEEKNLFEAATDILAFRALEDIETLEEDLVAAFEPSGDNFPVSLMDRIINSLNRNPARLDSLAAYFHPALLQTDAEYRDKVFYLASYIPSVLDLLIDYGLRSDVPEVQLQAIFAAGRITKPTPELLHVMRQLASSDDFISNAALMALGTLIGYAGESGADLALRLDDPSLTNAEIIATLYAIRNAGPNAVPLSILPASVFMRDNWEVRSALKEVLTGYPVDLTQLELMASNFPFNKSLDKSINIGGKSVSGDFAAELFIGTNFDCNQQYFNYKALARGNAVLNLFGYSKEAFLAEAIYGRENGAALANHILVKAWNKVLYSKDLGQLDCSPHIKKIGSTEKGLAVSYTLWVSVIPVTFSAGGSLSLDLSWGWQICDADLSAMVELIPGGKFSVYGKAEINLLIIRAGLDLEGSFNTQIRPQAYIHGSKCAVGFDVRQVSVPMSIKLDGYYAWKKCTFWIFNCKWGTRKSKTFASWSTPAVDKVIFKQEYQVKR